MLEDSSRPKPVRSTPDLVGSSGSHQVSADSGTVYQGSQRDPQNPGDQVEYEGDSSLAAHADFTTRVLENAVTTDLPISHYDEMASMMKDIRNTIRTRRLSAGITAARAAHVELFTYAKRLVT
uniref:Uncharacterized protein n=1 Tax=Colletotrichum fructicola (strain Nara gc5) TaxID=1213859 RepID=L2FIJ9_COLFN